MLTNAARLVKAQDLGGAPVEESVENEPATERVALVRTQTQASGITVGVERSSKDGINYNLVKCAYILLKEQGPVLWKCFALLGLATIVGGREHLEDVLSFANSTTGATYPAQAILFSRVVGAFSLSPQRGVAEGDFYSL